MNEGKIIIATALQQVGIENIDTNCTFTDLAALITSKLGNENIKFVVAKTSDGAAFTAPYTGKIIAVPHFQAYSTSSRSKYNYWLYDSTTSTYYYNYNSISLSTMPTESGYQGLQTMPYVINAIKDHAYVSNGSFSSTGGWSGTIYNECYWIYIDIQK